MIKIDLENSAVYLEENGKEKKYDIGSVEAFELISKAWIRSSWDVKYTYSFSWLGRPIIQLPEDMFRLQELIFDVKPDVIIETGIAHGGSAVFYAGLLKAMGKGKVVSVDIEIRPHNRKAIEEHFLSSYINMIEGSSIDESIVNKVKNHVNPNDKVIVFLDSCHYKDHVLGELNAYAPLVSVGSYIVAMDGIMEEVVGAPRTREDWNWNNPKQAALEFVKNNPDFIIEEPLFLFNEGIVEKRVTYCPSAFIKKIK